MVVFHEGFDDEVGGGLGESGVHVLDGGLEDVGREDDGDVVRSHHVDWGEAGEGEEVLKQVLQRVDVGWRNGCRGSIWSVG